MSTKWRHTPTPYEIAICQEFAHAVCFDGKYADTGQDNLQKIQNDMFVGVLGEWAAFWFLHSRFGTRVSPVNMTAYEPEQNRFDHDLTLQCEDRIAGIHVKTCPKRRQLDPAILIQKDSACGRCDTTFYNPGPLDALVFVQELDDQQFQVEGMWKVANILKAGIFQMPMKQSLRGYKDSLHLSSLKTLSGGFVAP